MLAKQGHADLPALQDLVITLRAPAMALSGVDGQIAASGASGCYVTDRRILSRLVVTLDGQEPEPVQGQLVGADTARFVSVARNLGDAGPDPSVLVERERTVTGAGMREIITLTSHARSPVTCTLGIALGCDLAEIHAVKHGMGATPLAADVSRVAAGWTGADGMAVRASLSPPADVASGPGTFEWTISLDRQQRTSVTIDVTVVHDDLPALIMPATRRPVDRPVVQACDHRLSALIKQSIYDLNALLAADALDPTDELLTAGAPWYLTLFGRDSIWAARMLLPLGTELAAGTLRSLARRQGRRHDPASAAEPGKIPHEARRALIDHGTRTRSGRRLIIPPLYYGSVDATPLWISLLHDAWRWGMPEHEVSGLIPHLQAALGWLRSDALGPSGFVQYADGSPHGLAHQGWKDSLNAVQFADGTLARAPIALCEVQAYAHSAALDGAELLDAFGGSGGDDWREWAARLRSSFRERFWISDAAGAFPAIAVDASGRPVDTVTSNVGHLLGTGLLDAEESDLVVRRLSGPDMDCGFGLRTMSDRSRGYNPLSYHCGSVWAHDTAIAVLGLSQAGSDAAGRAIVSLVRGLLAVSAAFGFRLPELHGGEAAQDGRLPIPYPAACRPQAWSAASAVALLSAILGLHADLPNGGLTLHPLRPSPVGELTVRGLCIGGEPLDVHLSATGEAQVLAAPPALCVTIDQ